MDPEVASFRLPRFDRLPGPERLDALIDVVGRAGRAGALPRPPGGAAETGEAEETVPARIRTLRTRLFLLGYLGRDNGSARIGERFRRALARFREEAGLGADRDRTWTALQELVSFETPPDLAPWMVDGEPTAPLRRAVETRLHVLGLMDSRHPKKPEKVTAALERFVAVARLLKLAPAPLRPETSPATLRVLFDQDANARRLADADQAAGAELPDGISAQRARGLIRSFVVANAKVELWLIGYDLPLAGRTTFDVPPEGELYIPARFPVFHALYSFWRAAGQSPTRARASASTITGALFRKLLDVQRQAARTPDPVAAGELYRRLVTADVETRLAVWERLQGIGSTLWDGIQRAWRWLKSLIVRGVRRAGAWIKNMARLAFRYAGNAFKVVARAVTSATGAIRFMLRDTVPGSDPSHLVIQRDADFDYRVALDRDHDPARVNELLRAFNAQATRFSLAVRILSTLARTLADLVRRSAFGGWFGFVAALLRLHSRRGLIGQILELGREQEELAAS